MLYPASWHQRHSKKTQLALIITTILSTETFAAAGGFANLPLNIERSLSDDSLGSQRRVNPNVMFLIDDTGSMVSSVPGSGGKRRIQVTREAMHKLADKHRDGLNYYVLDICGTSRQMPEIGKPLKYQDFQQVVGGMQAVCGDPYSDHSAEAYYDAIFFMRKNMNEAEGQYRCQKNFLLYFGDGEYNPTQVAWDKDGVAYAKASEMVTNFRGTWKNAIERTFKHITGSHWDCAERTAWYWWNNASGTRPALTPRKPTFRSDDLNGQYCRYARTHKSEWRKYAKFEPSTSGYGDSRVFDKKIYLNSSAGWQYIDSSVLAGPADWIGSNDLVTESSAKKRTDAAGKSWDDPDFPPQTIGTYGVGLGVSGGTYLDGASASAPGHKALLAQTPDQLFQALDRILSDIREKSKLDIPDSYSYTSPASLGGEKLDSAVGVHLLEGTIRSQLRFFKYDHIAKKFADTYTTPLLLPRNDSSMIKGSDAPNRPVMAYARGKYFYLNANRTHPNGLGNSDFGIPTTSSNEREYRNAMIPWITISQNDNIEDNDKSINNTAKTNRYPYPSGIDKGDYYRTRESVAGKHPNEYFMGDILDAPVVAGGTNINNLPEFLFVSANDGLSYIFKRFVSTDPNDAPYRLALRYFPMEMDLDIDGETIGTQMNNLRRNDYATIGSQFPHQWMNNGGVTVRSMGVRVPKGSSNQYTMAVSSPGQAGRGIFSLSLGGHDFFTGQPSGLNKNDDWLNTIPLFETPKKAENDLGYILGNPSVARLSLCRQNQLPGGRPLVFDGSGQVRCNTHSTAVDPNQNADHGVVYTTIYGNGYQNPRNFVHGSSTNNEKSALHVRLLWNTDVGLKGDGSAFGSSAPNGLLLAKIEVDNYSGLSMPVSVDMDFDGIADLAYASTYDGELYRFDFRADDPSKWSAHKLFSTQTVPYKYLESDASGVVVDKSGVPRLLENGTVKQKVMMAPDIFRMEHKGDDGKKKIRYMVAFGTGSNVFMTDLYDRSLQSSYNIEDRPEEEPTPAVIALDQLIKRELVDDPKTGLRDVKPRPSISAPSSQYRGWYANFDSKDEFGYPAGERMVASPIMIKTMVLNNTVLYEFSRKTAHATGSPHVDLCIVEDKTSVTNAGWVMGFSPINGDSTSPHDDSGSGSGSGSSSAKKPLVGLDGLNKGHEDGSGGVGKRLKGATNYTLFHRRQSLDTQSSVTDNGGLLSGLDPELKSMSVPRNDCMTRPEAESIRLIGQSKDGLDDSLQVIPNICPTGGGLLRLNIHDVPL